MNRRQRSDERSGSESRVRWRRQWIRSLGTLGLAGALVLGVAAPAFAEPDPVVPDSGSRPDPGGTTPGDTGTGDEPGSTAGNLPEVEPPETGPLASRISAETQAVQLLGERVKDATDRIADLRNLLDSTRRAAKAADESLERAEARAENTAGDAYRDYVAVPDPLRDFAPGLEHLAPGLRGSSTVEGKAAADTYTAAVDLARAAHDALNSAQDAVGKASDDLAALRKEFDRRGKALHQLRSENAEMLGEAEREADRYAESIDYDPGAAVHGMLPHPKALKAVRYALAQRGKPYVWGAEGPNSFDCSGLVWAAYRYAGAPMNARTARAQYYSTPKIRPGYLLPGDLIFFGPDKSDPESIHHVGVYIGRGRIVHAPTSGDVVKVSPIWWWEFFGATRVVRAVKAPDEPEPDPEPSPTPDPTWSTSPRPTPSDPTPSGPTPSDPAPSWSTSPTPSGTPSPTPSPGSSTPSPGPSGDSTHSGGSTTSGGSSEAASGCPSASGSPSPSGSRSPSRSPSASPAASPSGSSGTPTDPCATRVAAASDSGENARVDSRSAFLGYAWVLFGPSDKAAVIAGRRRTRGGSRTSGPRRRRTRF